MSKCQFVMVTVIENVHEIAVKWMDIVELGEAVDDATKLLIDGRLHEFHLSHVELSNTRDLEASANDGGCLSLRLTKRNVNQLGGCWDFVDLFEVVLAHGLLACLINDKIQTDILNVNFDNYLFCSVLNFRF